MRRVNNPSIDQWGALCTRPTASLDDVMPVVDEVFDAIQTQGDQAIQRFSQVSMAISQRIYRSGTK